MSEELGDIAARAVEAFNSRDREGWLALCTDDFQLHSRFSSVADTTFHGPAGVDAWWADLAEAWDSITIHLEDFRVLSPARAIMLFRLSGTGRESGVQLDEPVAHVWTLRGGLIAEIDYMDRAEAERIVRGE